METQKLDEMVVAFVEENFWALTITMVALVLVQWIWFLTRRPKDLLIDKDVFHALKLEQKKKINHNSCFLRFGLLDKRQELGLLLGKHLVFQFRPKDAEEPVSRKYTPVSDIHARGYVDFIIKLYPQGLMSQHLDLMHVGDRLSMRGPVGKFKYTKNMKKKIGMLAGGSGITPMYQLLNHILKDPKDKTHINLIYANVTAADILLRKNLDQFAAQYPTQFDVYYVIEKNEPLGWKYGRGYISKEMIQEHCPAPSDDVILVWCGPKPMDEAMKKIAGEIGYTEECTFKF